MLLFMLLFKRFGSVNLIEELEISFMISSFWNIPMDKFDYRYAEGKWTSKKLFSMW
jgi:hypothetical protein